MTPQPGTCAGIAAWCAVLVYGAAGNFVLPVLNMSPNAFKTVVDIGLLGTFDVLRQAHQYLRRPGVSVIIISAPNPSIPPPTRPMPAQPRLALTC